ncbi:MAG: sensor histidine kinase [Chloroflexi bacterium]|nr:MAG: sensor histidine kinase [Chloroflexota bacterium]
MSLRLRLTLLYSTLLGGTLLLFGSLVYGLVSLLLVSQVDNILTQQAAILTGGLLRVDANDQFDPRVLTEYQPTDSNLIFQVWGNDRRLQIERPRGWQAALDPAGLRASRPSFNSNYSQGVHLRVLSVPLVTPRGPAGVLQVALTLGLLDAAQQTLFTVLLTLAIISMALAGLASWLVTGQALAPLASATQVATRITRADDLSRRIPLMGNESEEVAQLITAFNETLSRLEGLFTTQRRFIADVSHELRTPLTVIKGEISLMRRIGQVDEESLTNVEGEVDRLTRLVGDLLLLAQAESGRLPMDMRPVELDTILLEVFQQMRTLAGDKLKLHISEIDQVQVMGDRDRLKQVLVNLVGNAIQYTPPGGRVTLSLQPSGGQARLIVSDTGPGIPAQDLPHIFERFYRGERSRKRTSGSQSSGFGLGLSIAYWIVRNHGGSIEVVSREGQGTTFCIWLPVQPTAPSPAETQA